MKHESPKLGSWGDDAPFFRAVSEARTKKTDSDWERTSRLSTMAFAVIIKNHGGIPIGIDAMSADEWAIAKDFVQRGLNAVNLEHLTSYVDDLAALALHNIEIKE